MQKIDEIICKIKESKNILLFTHENPDGDAVGSTMALFNALKNQFQKKVTAVCPSDIPKPFAFAKYSEEFKKDFIIGDYDLIIILDCGDLRRTGFPNRIKTNAEYSNRIVNIDHHQKNDIHKIASINHVNYDVSSTAEMVYELLDRMNINFNRDIATALLCGLYTDTGAFKHANTSAKALEIASKLMHYGARLNLITDNITCGKSVSTLKLWGRVLTKIKHNKELGLIYSVITQKDLKVCNASQDDLAGVVNLINTIPGTNAAILLSQIEPGKIKASIRTECNNVDVSRLASLFGGGGLKKASGFVIDGTFIETETGWSIEFI
jgi:phosphoesterase RecJ-like protein